MSNQFVEHALRELDIYGLKDDETTDELSLAMRRQILHLCEEFGKESHSHYTKNVVAALLHQLLLLKPITPLTGEDDEWLDLTDTQRGLPFFQNKRYTNVYKNSTEAWDNEAIVWWRWKVDGSKEFFKTADSKKVITFPYTPKTEFIEYQEQDDGNVSTQADA